jgi:CheY-like chemotaxis protein
LFGGGVDVQTQVAKGSTFRLYLRIDPSLSVRANTKAPVSARGRGRILVADDEPLLLELARRALQDGGYDVLTARDGQEAVEIFLRNPSAVDLVLFDVTMPRMSGPDAYARLAQVRPHLPVLFVTGFDFTGAAERRALGAHQVLEKPCRPSDLRAAIAGLLDASRLDR